MFENPNQQAFNFIFKLLDEILHELKIVKSQGEKIMTDLTPIVTAEASLAAEEQNVVALLQAVAGMFAANANDANAVMALHDKIMSDVTTLQQAEALVQIPGANSAAANTASAANSAPVANTAPAANTDPSASNTAPAANTASS
jgi:hypothetical protein